MREPVPNTRQTHPSNDEDIHLMSLELDDDAPLPYVKTRSTASDLLTVEDTHNVGRRPLSTSTKEELMLFGQDVAEICNGDVRDHRRTCELYEQCCHDRGDVLLSALATSADYATQLASAAEWAFDGFPSVVVGARYAAALCATRAPVEMLQDVQSPWPSWVLEVPDQLLTFVSAYAKEETPVRRLLVSRYRRRRASGELQENSTWDWTAYTADGTTVYRFGVDTERLLAEVVESPYSAALFPCELTDQDDRTSALIGRLIVGVCLAMEAGHVKRAPKGPPPAWRRRSKKAAPPPAGRVYVLGAPIQLDCRPSVRDYINGKRSAAPSVQHVVRGHWKNQPHGELNAHRKRIWVVPYWRGPDGAPVLLRDHVSQKE